MKCGARTQPADSRNQRNRLAGENRDNIADKLLNSTGKPFGSTLSSAAETPPQATSEIRPEREILASSELSAGTAAETGGTNGKQRNQRCNHNRGGRSAVSKDAAHLKPPNQAQPPTGHQHNRADPRQPWFWRPDISGSSHIRRKCQTIGRRSRSATRHAAEGCAGAQTCHQADRPE